MFFRIYDVDFAIRPLPRISAADILKEVSQFHGTPIALICGTSRKHAHALPRHEAMWLMRKLTSNTLTTIARCFSAHHTTVLGGMKILERCIAEQKVEGDDLICLLQRFANVDWTSQEVYLHAHELGG